MIIETFLFFNELDILRVKLEENFNVIDYFVLVESNLTFSGKKKEYIFDLNKDSFSEYLSKIIHIKLNQRSLRCAWKNESVQRNYIKVILEGLVLEDSDTIIHTDCDEIIHNKVIKEIITNGMKENIYALDLDVYYYDLTHKSCELWNQKAKVFKYSLLKNENVSVSLIRNGDASVYHKKAGWHLSYFGGENKIKEKINAYSHQEYNNDNVKNKIVESIHNNRDLFGRQNIFFKIIKIEDNPYLPRSFLFLL
jgi:beta-1,4-mannosyl-glycoprotein beta-1,4-N-acetylglucosaminyltransferase